MTIAIPDGSPRHRFTRYVRTSAVPPTRRSGTALYPLRPATRNLRVGIEIRTLGEPQQLAQTELFTILRRDDIDPFLMIHSQDGLPVAWMEALDTRTVHRLNYDTFERAGRVGDSTQLWVTTEEDGEFRSTSACNFFGAYADFDGVQAKLRGDDDLTPAGGQVSCCGAGRLSSGAWRGCHCYRGSDRGSRRCGRQRHRNQCHPR
jgi:hypothetical protein